MNITSSFESEDDFLVNKFATYYRKQDSNSTLNNYNQKQKVIEFELFVGIIPWNLEIQKKLKMSMTMTRMGIMSPNELRLKCPKDEDF